MVISDWKRLLQTPSERGFDEAKGMCAFRATNIAYVQGERSLAIPSDGVIRQ